MVTATKKLAQGLRAAINTVSANPAAKFNSWEYLRHTQRRQEHLASLQLDLTNRTVLEVGAGVGDHTSFFVDRGCQVVSTEGRAENLRVLKMRFPDLDVRLLDLEQPTIDFAQPFEVVYCYGLLYHLGTPAEALEYMAKHCRGQLLLETCVSPSCDTSINLVDEPARSVTQAVSGCGCRPSRNWVFEKLASLFEHVYMPTTQPAHEQFPTDWSEPHAIGHDSLTRSVFVASRTPLENARLVSEIPMVQERV